MTEPQQPQSMSVPLEGLVETTREQRNTAMDQAAAYKAVVADLQAQLDQARAENARLSGDAPTVAGSVEAQ